MGVKSYRNKAVLECLRGLGLDGGDVTMNQVLHWVERGVVKPSIKEASGHPSFREYSLFDIFKAGMISRLLGAGMPLTEVGARISKLTAVTCLSDENQFSLEEVLRRKSTREKYRYFFMIKYHDGNYKKVESRSGYCAGYHEIAGLFARRDRPLYLVHMILVDILEILEVIEEKTGDSI